MDSHVGLDYIVDNPDYCVKLATALDTACPSVKKQVVELLSALCVYSQDGRQRAIDTLHAYQTQRTQSGVLSLRKNHSSRSLSGKQRTIDICCLESPFARTTRPTATLLHATQTKRKNERYRLRIVVEELQNATAEDYRTALLAFINCLVISTPVLKDRIRIRNEFIGLKLLPILNELRKSHAPDLRVQLDVFDDQRETDEELSNHGPPGIDLSSHVDVFYAIFGQIADTPQEIPFLSILQHLLRLDPKDAASDLAWDTAETLVHRATLLENREDATKLLRSPSLQTNLCCHCRGTDQTCGASRKASLSVNNSTTPLPPLPPPPPPPVPVDPSGTSSPTQNRVLPPPPPPPLLTGNVTYADASMDPPPMPPPLHALPVTRVPTPEPQNNHARLLPQQEIPTPKAKMKTINWNKIPNHKVIGKRNIWSLVADEHQNSPMADIDWAEMEGLFCQQVPPVLPAASCSSYGANSDAERRRREPTEIALLDGKRSLNVNIFLKQFRSSNEDIIRLIKDGSHDEIGAEKLRGLLKILPEVDELEMLKSFDGDKSKLGNAEKFFLQLIQVPNYKLRIECMLLKEEFAANMSYLEPSINSMILAGEDLMTNKPLQEVLYMVLVAGNFLNSGGYAGNAAGVKLSSLQKITEIRANKPGMNLIHYVALQAERKRKDLLDFAKGMTTLEAATKTTTEQLNNEFNALDTKIKKIKAQINFPSTETDIQEQMAQFLQIAEREMSQLKRDMEELETLRRSLAEFFCEDSNTFKIEECLKIFHQFCQKFNQAVAENERRRIQEEQILARRKQREEQLLARKRLLTNNQPQIEAPTSESECNLIGYDPFDLASGLPQRNYGRPDVKIKRLQNGAVTSDEDVSITGSPNIRRRLGSCSGGIVDQQSTKEETYSPDVTPNGTLRRRRSRIPCEDDDGNLMDFLRTSGQDGTRERKSWGSLDRSWARRARGQSRRSDLLNADFSIDRERPSSPSPLLESKPFLQEEETKPAGKAWRQKIEAWLSENEKEDRAGEELQKKARQLHHANRRSYEDSESEGKTNIQIEAGSTHDTYSEVYDWRPSVEKTDVMRTMEAIEEAETHPSQKDKSPWRKSSLNVPNSMEETDPRYSRRLRSRLSAENVLTSSTLQSIKEEERKKNKTTDVVNSNPQDELTIYLRQPYGDSQTAGSRRFSKLKKGADEEKITDKIEIDSDNIETPPATRKLFSPPKEVKPVEKEPCKRERCSSSFQSRDFKNPMSKNVNNTDFGIGNFDRYSAARRTRRYKKNQDSAEKDSKQESMVDAESLEAKPADRPHSLPLSEEEGHGEDSVPSVWQEKSKRQAESSSSFDIDTALAEIARSGEDLQRLSRPLVHRTSRLPVSQPSAVVAVTNTVLSPVMQESRPRESSLTVLAERAVTSRERQRTMIDPSQVKEAIRLTNNPPSQVNECQNVSTCRSRKQSRSFGKNESTNDEIDLAVTDSNRCQENADPDVEIYHDKRAESTLRNQSKVQSVRSNTEGSVFHPRFVPPDINVTTSTPSSFSLLPASGKARDQEMNDEGFEETQSLVSETLSQETSSGNYETDTHDSTRCSPAELRYSGTDNHPPVHTTIDHIQVTEHDPSKSIGDATLKTMSSPSPPISKGFEKRAGSMKHTSEKSSFLPKRTNALKRDVSVRKAAESMQRNSNLTFQSNNGQTRNEVERSGSRSSLRSSRSSLNSATSVNTVRNLVPNHAPLRTYTSAICALTNDLRKSPSHSPLPPKSNEKRRTNPRATVTRIPASRSSSSGSSVGPTARTARKSLGSTTDVQKANKGRALFSRSSSSGSGSSMRPQSLPLNRVNVEKVPSSIAKSKLIHPRTGTRNHSFMRPTAASVNKGSIPNLPRSIKGLVK